MCFFLLFSKMKTQHIGFHEESLFRIQRATRRRVARPLPKALGTRRVYYYLLTRERPAPVPTRAATGRARASPPRTRWGRGRAGPRSACRWPRGAALSLSRWARSALQTLYGMVAYACVFICGHMSYRCGLCHMRIHMRHSFCPVHR